MENVVAVLHTLQNGNLSLQKSFIDLVIEIFLTDDFNGNILILIGIEVTFHIIFPFVNFTGIPFTQKIPFTIAVLLNPDYFIYFLASVRISNFIYHFIYKYKLSFKF